MMKFITSLCIALFLMGCVDAPLETGETLPNERMKEENVEKPIMTWSDLTARTMPVPSTTIRYNDLQTGIVDVWLPDSDGPHPVVLMIHGGCWQKSIADRTLMNYMADFLRREGMAVWNVEYRGVDEAGGGYPGTFNDVSKAGNALNLHAAELNLDLDRVAGFGHSAGGHLITWYAGSVNLPPQTDISAKRKIDMKGVINSGGLADLVKSEPVTLKSCLSDIRHQLTGPVSSKRPDPFADTSSDRLLPTGIPVFNVNGAKDSIAPISLGEAYTALAAKSGDQSQSYIVAGEGHVELIAPETEAYKVQLQILKGLLDLE